MPTLPFDLSRSPTARAFGQLISGLDPRQLGRNPTEALARSYQTLRSGLFFAESLPLFWIQRPRGPKRGKAPAPEVLEKVLASLQDLLARDAALFGEGVAPLSSLTPRAPLLHGLRLMRILADGARVSARQRARRSRDFSKDAERLLEELPAYYRRNFHYQTDGYLSADSAALYEHQVEILFRGGADAMRRLILRPLKEALGPGDGRGLRLLELGSGTGIATHFVAQAYPEARITAVDLSYPYVQHARASLHDRERVTIMQGDAAKLEFANDAFDGIYSVFLFHELPLPVREAVLAEGRRVLRPGGFFGLVDSLQKGDEPDLDWALDAFPREFHEPYYANYAAQPMERLLTAAGFEQPRSENGYLSKVVSAINPPCSPG